ncbi:ciliary neurotrophic factor [Chanos chanos]|uniref:Ciliary neurotrophic factor n=1 Tax=Chanos chanos TaxID=29144 RepID=A0A6J2WKA2_CHACN|nr:uncharacterized protein LOC115824120 [Chanos chanos]
MAGLTNGKQGSGGQAGKAAALARLLHEESLRLLELYREKESLPLQPVEGDRMVSSPPFTSQLSAADKLCFLHAALTKCVHLLDRAIGREDTEFGNDKQGEYTKLRQTVKDRLRHLLQSTERLLVEQKGSAACSTEADVKEETDGLFSGGTFNLKMWIHRVLQEVVHWSDTASQTLHSLPADRGKDQKRMSRTGRRSKRSVRK